MIARRFVGVLALALSLSPLHAADRTSLGYHMPPGETFALNMSFNADVPTQGPISGNAFTKTRVEAVLADFLRLKVSVSSPAGGGYVLGMGMDLSPAGSASNITGVDMNNEKDALVAKNIASLGAPALPDSDVVIGTAWEAERTVFLPKAPFPGVPTSARVRFTYKVQSIAQENGREVVTLAVTGKEPSGQSVKINCAGFWVVTGGSGKPLRAKIEGEASMRVLVSTLKMPFKVEAGAGTLAETAAN